MVSYTGLGIVLFCAGKVERIGATNQVTDVYYEGTLI